MYTALGIMLAGVLIGRVLRTHVCRLPLRRLTMAAIFLLLFLLGVSIGANAELLASLPSLGARSGGLILLCLAGSILCARLATPFIRLGRSGNAKNAR